ncbi:sensor histidine kinase KdpD [Cupriavidus respiraculi]|uniref:sensor histidine kinase n=1 Tax=Cupriavidus respiraculi TaxID=195930 RepID=UPI001C96C48A|nr:sensor histidine kinase KdpD [Cupriavidus respiraculi]MBY4946398.1 sensor histidine kinase KdpD [Cupriavidus respiraculi]
MPDAARRDPSERPDPDALLRRVQAEHARAARGRLRVYFGASAGVGKTYAMLSAAVTLRERGADVLIGVIETHGRADTAALAASLERLPMRAVPYRGRTLQAFDLDAALARRPALLLVDELAHTNVAGGRHPKRWQDIDELLAAGIDVWTTVNVQHLDSLNEAVGGITGIRVRETVPDAVFDQADEVVLVDLPVDELLRRLEEGKVYLPEQAREAARHFFRKGNLIALRELALRRTAERVDDDVQAYRHAASVQPVWRTREAVLACVGPGADAEQVVRGARRLARQLGCDWHAVTVATPRLVRRDDGAIPAAMRLAEELGARTATLAGADVGAALAGYVRRHSMTKAVLGRSPAPLPSAADGHRGWQARLGDAMLRPLDWRWARAGRHGTARALAQRCPDIDVVHVAREDVAGAARARAAAEAPLAPAGARGRDYLWAAAWCLGATALSALARPVFDPVNIAMLYLAAVAGVALRHGRGPAALASLLSVAAFDFFFVPPRLSFAVGDVQYLLTFVVLLAVGLVIGQLTAGLREQAEVAVGRETEARTLYELARELSGALTADQIVEVGGRFLRAAFDAEVAVFLGPAGGRVELVREDAAPGGEHPGDGEAIDPVLAQWVFDHGQAAGTGTGTLPGSTVLYLPLKAPMHTRGVLAVEARAWQRLAQPAARRQAEMFATLMAVALERLHYVEVAQQALVSIESERLRSSLLAAVSHDLRTPLTGLMGMAESLQRDGAALTPRQAGTVAAIREQAARMRAMVVNLLDMARLQGRAVPLRREWQSAEELVGAALAGMREALAGHPVSVSALAALPLVQCDAVLMERVLCNLLENAAKHTPVGTAIRIGGRVAEAEVWLTVEDDGPGVPRGQERAIFETFHRGGRESATAGVGLGLAVCEAIMQAHGGRIWVEPAHGATGSRTGGARFVVALPRGEPPAVEPEPPAIAPLEPEPR